MGDTKQSDIYRQLELLGKVNEKLRERLHVLSDKLLPITRSQLSGAGEKMGGPEEILCPLGDSIKKERVYTQNTIDILENIIGNIDL